MRQDLLDEVSELTSFIQPSGNWSETRQLVRDGGFDPDLILLISFMEGEEGQEWGVVATQDQSIFQWERNTYEDPSSVKWQELTGEPDLLRRVPQVEVVSEALRLREPKGTSS